MSTSNPTNKMTPDSPPDRFGLVADAYQKFRPDYPAALYEWLTAAQQPIAGQNIATKSSWDVGCGNGQASVALAALGWHVTATDLSASQLANAIPANNVSYLAATAEQAPLADQSVSLVTVAQAAHWFDMPAFCAEVERVLIPNGLLVLWTYSRPQLPMEALQQDGSVINLDEIFADYHTGWLKPWWPEQRKFVDTGYADLPMPLSAGFTAIETPSLWIERKWVLADLLGYAASWSATARCQTAGIDAVAELDRRLRPHWPALDSSDKAEAADMPLTVRWPLPVLAHRRLATS